MAAYTIDKIYAVERQTVEVLVTWGAKHASCLMELLPLPFLHFPPSWQIASGNCQQHFIIAQAQHNQKLISYQNWHIIMCGGVRWCG
jgi:hypothetical protein